MFWVLLLFVLSAARDLPSICSHCNCSDNFEATCDRGIPPHIIESGIELGIQKIRFVGTTAISLSWRSFTSSRRLRSLDLARSSLACTCENQWLLQVNQSYWDRKLNFWAPSSGSPNVAPGLINACEGSSEKSSVTTLRSALRLPHQILLPDPLTCTHSARGILDEDRIKEFLKSCDEYTLIPETNSTAERVTASCKVEKLGYSRTNGEEPCLLGSFMKLVPKKTNRTLKDRPETNEECKAAVEVSAVQGSVNESGWLVCRLRDVDLPQVRLVPLLVQGPPVDESRLADTWGADGVGRIFEIKFLSYPPPIDYRWHYQIRNELWEIEPSPDFPHFVFEERRCGGPNYIARIIFKEVHCYAGLYQLAICNPIGCRDITFPVQSAHPEGYTCAEANTTFLVRNITILAMPASTDSPLSWTLFGGLLSSQLPAVGLIIVGVCLCRRRASRRRKATETRRESQDLCGLKEWKCSADAKPLLGNRNYIPWLQTIAQEFGVGMIAPEEIIVEERVGEGAFGEVFRVSRVMPTLDVDEASPSGPEYIRPFFPENFGDRMAMKQLKFVSPEKLEDLKREAKVMMNLRHPNIVAFYGVTLRGEGFALLFEYMERGDLANLLREHNPSLIDLEADGKQPLLELDLLRYAHQAAAGLEYLARHKLVHRDLAARNCLVSNEGTVKLSDFGMSRDICVTNYYKMGGHAVVPLRWLPPESIIYRKFTAESDLWSFGVLLWEIFSYGEIPWCQYNNDEVLEIVKEGRILPAPDQCPSELYETVILQCWKLKPSERPDPAGVKSVLESLVEGAMGYCSLTPETTDLTVHSAILHPPLPSNSADSMRADWQLNV